MRVREALPGRARAQQELRHRRREPEADRRDVALQRLHRVVDREAGVDLAAGGVQVERDRRVGVVGLEHEQLRADALGELAVDRAGEHDAALVEHAPEEAVVDRVGDAVSATPWLHIVDRDQVLMCNP